jgi:hypothetical protein
VVKKAIRTARDSASWLVAEGRHLDSGAVAVENLRRMPVEGPPSWQEPPSPPRFTVLDSLRRQLPIALLPVVVLVAVAVAISYARTPTYTSEARLNVGGLNLTQQSIQGYTAAVTQLAVAYARAIHATGVVTPVARRLKLPPDQVVGHLDAVPIQGSSVIRILATGDSPGEAQRLADRAADSLVAYAIDLNSGRSASGRILDRFKRAARDWRKAVSAAGSTPANSSAQRRAQDRIDSAKLERDTAGFLYTQSQAGQAATELVQKLAPAEKATSDRANLLQTLVAAAAIAGILIGIGLAVMRANAVARRRLGSH